MAMRLFLLYAVVEMAVIVALTATIGFGWTVLLLIGAFVLGIALAGSQLRRQLAALQRGMRDPAVGVTDGVLVALGSVLTVVPGLVTSVAGLLLLLPPTRAALRPVAGAVAARALSRRVAFVDLPGQGRGFAGRGDYIDGEVVDVYDPEVPAVVRKPE
ncbi:MAG: membrane protein FxsA [Mycobacterium sp.]|nr:membrane protein FxsA [Mycobacterium sp.]